MKIRCGFLIMFLNESNKFMTYKFPALFICILLLTVVSLLIQLFGNTVNECTSETPSYIIDIPDGHFVQLTVGTSFPTYHKRRHISQTVLGRFITIIWYLCTWNLPLLLTYILQKNQFTNTLKKTPTIILITLILYALVNMFICMNKVRLSLAQNCKDCGSRKRNTNIIVYYHNTTQHKSSKMKLDYTTTTKHLTRFVQRQWMIKTDYDLWFGNQRLSLHRIILLSHYNIQDGSIVYVIQKERGLPGGYGDYTHEMKESEQQTQLQQHVQEQQYIQEQTDSNTQQIKQLPEIQKQMQPQEMQEEQSTQYTSHKQRKLFDEILFTMRDSNNNLFINLSSLPNPLYGHKWKTSSLTAKIGKKRGYLQDDFVTINDCPFAAGTQEYIRARVFCDYFLFHTKSTSFDKVVGMIFDDVEGGKGGQEEDFIEDFLSTDDLIEIMSQADSSQSNNYNDINTSNQPENYSDKNQQRIEKKDARKKKKKDTSKTTQKKNCAQSDGTVDISALQFECAKCHHSYVSVRKGQLKHPASSYDDRINQTLDSSDRESVKNDINNATRSKSRTVNSLYEPLKEMMKAINQNLAYICVEYFRTKKGQKELEDMNPETMKHIFKSDDSVSDDMMLWIKDRMTWSNKSYKDVYTLFGAPQMFQKWDIIKKTQEIWNERVKEEFNPTATRDGTRVNIRSLMTCILQLYKKMGYALPTDVLWKLCVDGRTVGNGQTAFGIVPINLRKSFPTQDIRSVFIFTIYKGPDNNEFISANIGSSKDEIKDLEKNGITCDGQKINIGLIHNSDLKALGECSNLYEDDYICPFCTCSKEERFNIRDRSYFNLRKRKIMDLFGITRHTICCLHCKQRITEYYIKHMVQGDEDRMMKLEKAARSIHRLGNFRLIEKKSKWDDRIIGYNVKMLKGDECDAIIDNYQKLIDAIEPTDMERKLLENVWFLYKKIIQEYIERKSTDDKINYHQLIHDLDQWVAWMHAAFTMKESMPYYVHIIWAHLPDLLEEYTTLAPFSNQGFENSHQEHDRIWQRMVSKGGRKKKDEERKTPIRQLMDYFLRRLLMTLSVPGTVWQKKYLDPEKMKKVQVNKERKREKEDAEKGITRIKICDDDLDKIAHKICVAKENLPLLNEDEDVIFVDDTISVSDGSDGSDQEDDECQIIEAIITETKTNTIFDDLNQRIRDFRYRRTEIAVKSHSEIDKMFDLGTVKRLKITIPKRGTTRLAKADLLLKLVMVFYKANLTMTL